MSAFTGSWKYILYISKGMDQKYETGTVFNHLGILSGKQNTVKWYLKPQRS